MDGSGYNDPKKLADAKALALMFGKSSQKGGGGGGGGGKAFGKDSGSRGNRGQYNYSPPPPPPPATQPTSNVPRPSQRNYSNTLISGPLKPATGRMLGNSTVAFLERREKSQQQTAENPSQETPKESVMAAGPPSMDDEPAKNLAQGQDMARVSGEESHTAAPAPAKEGPMVDTTHKTPMALSTEQKEVNPKPSTSATPAQIQNPTPGTLPKNIAETWASALIDFSDEEEEEGEIIETPKAEPQRKKDVPDLPKVKVEAEDLIMASPDKQPSPLCREDIRKPLSPATEAMYGISFQKVRKTTVPASQGDGRSPVQGVSAINPTPNELATARDQTRGETRPGEQTNTSNLRPQAPGFVPGPRDVSMNSPKFLDSASMASSPAARLGPESPGWAPPHQSHAQYPVVGNLGGNPFSFGHLVTVTPVRIADGCLIPGPTNGHVLMEPNLNAPHHPQVSPMQFPGMPMAPGPSLPTQAGENKTAAPVQKPKGPRVTKGLRSSMWAS